MSTFMAKVQPLNAIANTLAGPEPPSPLPLSSTFLFGKDGLITYSARAKYRRPSKMASKSARNARGAPVSARVSAFFAATKSLGKPAGAKARPMHPGKPAPMMSPAASSRANLAGSNGGGRLSAVEKLAAKRKRDEEEEEAAAAAAAAEEEEERMAELEAERDEREKREREQSALAIKKAAAAAKGKAAAPSHAAQHGLKKRKGKGPADEGETEEGDGLSEYEKQRLEKIKKNAEFMASLGIVDVAKKMAPPKKPKAKPVPARRKRRSADHSDSGSDEWGDRSDEDDDEDDGDDESVRRSTKKRGETAHRVMPGRAARDMAQAKASSSPAFKRKPGRPPKSDKHGVGGGSGVDFELDPKRNKPGPKPKKMKQLLQEVNAEMMELVGRKIRVSVFTADVGRKEWHSAEIMQHRMRKGKHQHLVQWSAEGEDDEWLVLDEEEYQIVDAEDEELEDSNGDDFRVGDVVETKVIGDKGKEEIGYVRLLERLGDTGGDGEIMWKVHWLYLPSNVGNHVLSAIKAYPVDKKKEIFFSAHEDTVSQDTFEGLADVVFTAANFRTVLKTQKLCRFVYDFQKDKLHKLSEGHNWIKSFSKIITELLGKKKRRKGGKSEDADDAVAAAAATSGPSKGPAMSDSEDEQEADSDGGEASGVDGEGAGADEGVDDEDDVVMSGWEGGLCAAGGYLAAVAAGKINKLAATSWRDVAQATEEEVAECFARLPQQCSDEMDQLHAVHASNFGMWHRRLLAGFSILFYGFGSKLSVAREFALRTCTLGPVVEVNAYVSGMKLQRVLDEVCSDVLGHRHSFRSVLAQADFIAKRVIDARIKAGLMPEPEDEDEDEEQDQTLMWRGVVDGQGADDGEGEGEDGEDDEREDGEEDDGDDEGTSGGHVGPSSSDVYVPDIRQTRAMAEGGSGSRSCYAPTDLYIIVHNIESPALKSSEAQQALARLAATPGIHLVATIDDVNACLIWDPLLRSSFNFVSADLTTFARYVHESPYACGSGSGAAAEDQTRSALVVMRSLNSNARGIFGLLIKEQIEGKGKAGMTLATLFERCRECFLSSTQVALKGHLAELRDHKLLRERRAADGSQVLYVPMSSEALRLVWAEIRSTAKST